MIRDSYNCSNDFSDNSSLMYIYKKAINGDADQMQSLGDKYYIGEEVDQNYEKAFFWYENALKNGIEEAKNNLGVMLISGLGCEINFERGYHYLAVLIILHF